MYDNKLSKNVITVKNNHIKLKQQMSYFYKDHSTNNVSGIAILII